MTNDQGPLVSIAMATYNAGRFLDAQLASLFNQTYPNIEIVVSDDGSDDGTYERLLDYSNSEPRLRVLEQGAHRGFNANFMHCFHACRGQWISPCDQDDIWEADKTAALMAAVKPGGLAFCDSSFIDDHGNPIRYRGARRMSEKFFPDNNLSPLSLLMRSSVSGHAMLFPQELLDSLPQIPEHNYYDQWITLWGRALDRPLHYVDQPLVQYRRHDEAVVVQRYTPSKASQKIRTLQAQWAAAATLEKNLPESAQKREISLYLAALWQWLEKPFCPRAFVFFFRRRNDLYRRESGAEKLKKSLRYLIGYGLRSRLRPKRYPPVTGSDGPYLRFDVKEPAG